MRIYSDAQRGIRRGRGLSRSSLKGSACDLRAALQQVNEQANYFKQMRSVRN